ncbi:SRPBCC family protein [Actinoplanes sp. CA-015351]|uniref:SRPBCC family protein n=1 Tax=Actinoplanes sp. CA-015351 TaxID=3239897 RepID=UPI003D955BC6
MDPITSTLPVRLTREQLWAGLVYKAADPVPFLPAVTGCTVLERYPDGLLREIVVRGTDRQRERVTFSPPDRMDFAQLTEPLWETISNIVTDRPDGPALTLSLRLSAAGADKAAADPEFLTQMREFVEATLVAVVNTLHRLAAEPAGQQR